MPTTPVYEHFLPDDPLFDAEDDTLYDQHPGYEEAGALFDDPYEYEDVDDDE